MENYNWKLGSFATGNIIDMPLYVIGEPEIDITVSNEDTANIKILMTPYSDDIRNSWASYFKEVLHFCVAVGETSGDVLWAGMINKITPSIAEQTLEFQLVNPSEYTSARIVGEAFGEVVEDPTAGVEIEGANYSEIIAGLVRRCFAPIARANTPQPPNILLEALPAKTGDAKKMTFLYSDMISYSEAIENVIEESGLDIETRYSAYWGNEAKTRVKWRFVAGSNSAPHINEGQTLSIQLRDAENIRKVSEFESLVDSTELFNSFYISSKSGDEEKKNGMDLKNAVSYDSDFPILLETYYSPGVELSEAQLNSQLSSYISQGMNTKRTGSVTIELESEDFILWAHSYLGRIVNFTGYDNTLSAGHSVSLRIVGVRFDLASGRVLIDLMSKQPRYPKLPRKKGAKSKKKTDKKKISPSNKFVKAKDVAKFKGSGGLPSTPPWEGGGTYPPSDSGPGGQWGTGSESVKDDNSPYEISNYGQDWNPQGGFGSSFPANQKLSAQNLSNVIVTMGQINSGTYYWKRGFVGARTTKNATSAKNSTSPALDYEMRMGSGYFSEGSLVNYSAERNNFNANSLIDDLLLNYSLWGIDIPDKVNGGYTFAGITFISVAARSIFIVRDNVFIVSQVNIDVAYKSSDGSYLEYDNRVTGSIFYGRKMLSWDQFGEVFYVRNATILNAGVTHSSRVGDYGVIKTNSALYSNNFANYTSITSGNWYTAPISVPSNTIIIGKIFKEGQYQSYLVSMGAYEPNKVFGLKLIGENSPVAVHDAVWEDLSSFFPFPTTASTDNTYSVDSIGGFLVARIGGADRKSIQEEVYMQDEQGTWRKLKTTGNVGIISPISFQFGNWVYYFRTTNFVTSFTAFHLRKIAHWAIDSEASNNKTVSARSVSKEELQSINNMISEGGAPTVP